MNRKIGFILLGCALLNGCAGSPVRLSSDTPEQLSRERTEDLCSAVSNLSPENTASLVSKSGATSIRQGILQELTKRGSIRVQFTSQIDQHRIVAGMNLCEVDAAKAVSYFLIDRVGFLQDSVKYSIWRLRASHGPDGFLLAKDGQVISVPAEVAHADNKQDNDLLLKVYGVEYGFRATPGSPSPHGWEDSQFVAFDKLKKCMESVDAQQLDVSSYVADGSVRPDFEQDVRAHVLKTGMNVCEAAVSLQRRPLVWHMNYKGVSYGLTMFKAATILDDDIVVFFSAKEVPGTLASNHEYGYLQPNPVNLLTGYLPHAAISLVSE